MSIDPNPFNWSPNIKTIGGLAAIIVTIVGASWSAADTIASKIYAFAQGQTQVIGAIEALRSDLKDDVVPRVTKLEQEIGDAKADAAATKQRVDDMGQQLGDIKTLTQQNLTLSRSHDADIKATRQAVAPDRRAPPY